MADSFVHLHVHTEYSMLDGAARLDDLFAEAARQEMPAIAMTDHGNVFGAYDFYMKAQQHGVKPIIGIEGYYAPQGRHTRAPFDFGNVPGDEVGEDGTPTTKGKQAYTHMTVVAETTEGMHNLFRLSSLASIEGFYRKPRFDRELLDRYGRGLIATTGCPSGEVNMWLRSGDYEKARAAAADFRDILGPGNFFCELMDHGLDIEQRHREDLLRIARDLDLPLLATNDVHYVHEADAEAHDVLLCIGTRASVNDEKRFRFNGSGYYLKSAQQMRATWQELPEACDNTLLIAERCQVAFDDSANLMPSFPVPEGETEDSWLAAEVRRGLAARFAPHPVPDRHQTQAEYELRVISQMGYPSYFLVVADLVRYAKENGIRVGPGRGSAAGALIAWALGITELDPLKHGLIFERFLNPDRVSMPDIDMDFDERRRGEMIRYATEKYGDDQVAQIVTYSSIKAKAAIKDSARALGFPYSLGDQITKAMPDAVMGKDISLSGIFDQDHERFAEAADFRALHDAEESVQLVVKTARGLEGLKRQPGVHAAGVILSRAKLLDVLPLWRRDSDGSIITQLDMDACEKLGLLKMDFLGLRNLTVLDDCLVNIVRNRGETIVLEDLSLDDRASYELLARGDTLGVFQLDGGPMRQLLRSMKPDTFDDISAVLALYRPGPMGANAHNDYADRKNGRQPVTPIHPELEEPLRDILAETYGVIVYQEQVMTIAQRVAGYSLGAADLLRRAMGKKKKEILDQEYGPFAAGMRANGFSDEAIEKLWGILVPFADYAFNKAHSAGYGLVSYWTAYLKANYPTEYMAALLESVKDNKDKSAVYLTECRHMGVKVLPPDVNESQSSFTAVGDNIRFGLSAIRNVGEGVVDSIIASREAHGRFADFYDFLAKVEAGACNKRLVESLIKAGAFDSLGHTRRGLVAVHEQAVDEALAKKRAEAVGQFDLFGDADIAEHAEVSAPPIPIGEWDKSVLLANEREMLGLYVSDHPLEGLESQLRALVDAPIADVLQDEKSDGRVLTVAGLVTSINRRITKGGKPYAQLTLEDLSGEIQVMIFPKVYQLVAPYCHTDAILAIKGRIDASEESIRMMAMEVSAPDLTADAASQFLLTVSAQQCTPDTVDRLKNVLSCHPGGTDVHLQMTTGTRTTVLRLDEAFRVNPSPALGADLKALLGPHCLPGT